MHSADYAVARWQDARLSVCHTPVSCLNGYTYPESFSPLGSPTILVMTHSVDMFQWNTNRDLHTPCSTVLFRVTLSELNDLAKYSMTRSVARSRCDCWASCSIVLKLENVFLRVLKTQIDQAYLTWVQHMDKIYRNGPHNVI